MKNRGYRFQDLTGLKYGMLTAIKLHSVTSNGTKWNLKCDCGKEVVRLTSNFKKKQHRHSCGCQPTNPGRKDAGFIRLYRDYKASANLRGYSFSLSFKKFKQIVLNSCQYCGINPTLRYSKQVAHKIYVNGIDRVDNSRGYSVSNSVACCSFCNKAKGSLSVKDFLENIKSIYYCNKQRVPNEQ